MTNNKIDFEDLFKTASYVDFEDLFKTASYEDPDVELIRECTKTADPALTEVDVLVQVARLTIQILNKNHQRRICELNDQVKAGLSGLSSRNFTSSLRAISKDALERVVICMESRHESGYAASGYAKRMLASDKVRLAALNAVARDFDRVFTPEFLSKNGWPVDDDATPNKQ
jgi:hypothetical protein